MAVETPEENKVSTPQLTSEQKALAHALTEHGVKQIADTILLYMEKLDAGDFAEGDRRAFRDRYVGEVARDFGRKAGDYLSARLAEISKRY